MDMGYKVTQRDVEQMMAVLAPTAESQELGRTRRVPTALGHPEEVDAPPTGIEPGTANNKTAKSATASVTGDDEEEDSAGDGGERADEKGGGGGSDLRRTQSAQPSATISFDRYRRTMAASFSRTFNTGEYVFKEGDPVDAFYVITRGACEVRVTGPDGERQIATLGPGDFFGETGLLEGREVRAASVLAKSPIEVLAIDKGVFNEIARADGASTLSASMRERAEQRQRARLMKVFEAMSVSLSQRRSFAKGQVVYQQGQPATTFYIVNRGNLEMSLSKPDGGSVTVKRLKPGDHLG
jgi:CRP-like cAMP-binding protein